jgi:hypothetical protein
MNDVNDEISEEEEQSLENAAVEKNLNQTPSQRFFTNNLRVSFMDKVNEFDENPQSD